MDAKKLTKPMRDAIPEEHFAVPGKRKLPIHDERHTRLAWDMVDRTGGLTPEEKSAARGHILRRAKELGIDTTDWHRVKAMRFDAMALNISNDDDHPNKMPFSGVLTKVDEPSDEPPGGSNGRRILVTSEAAQAALKTLVGMAVDFTAAFDGHDPQAKVGLITSADVIGNEIVISGYIYASDFPEVAASIKALKSVLGFSFEAQRIYVEDPGADVLKIVELVFTGAAILRKDKAAYHSTSLAANAAKDIDMTPDELKALLAEALKPINDKISGLEASNATLGTANAALAAKVAADLKVVEANAATAAKVEPHAAGLESCAASMEAAGIGLHPTGGHVQTLKRMASAMRADAATGKVPHIFRDHDYPYSASADRSDDKSVADKISAAAEETKKLLAAKDDEVAKLIASAVETASKAFGDKLAAAETKIADLKAGKRADSATPERKTLSPVVTAILARANLTTPEGDAKLSASAIDAAIKPLNLEPAKRIQMKIELERAGLTA